MIAFIKTPDKNNPHDSVTVEVRFDHNEVCLSDILEEVETFIRACGFHLDGHIDIVSDEVNKDETI